MPDFVDVDSVSQVPDCVISGDPRSGTSSPDSGSMMAMSDFAGDIEQGPGVPSLPSGININMPDVDDVGDVSHVPECVCVGDPRSGTISPESGSMKAMSDFVSDIDPGPDNRDSDGCHSEMCMLQPDPGVIMCLRSLYVGRSPIMATVTVVTV